MNSLSLTVKILKSHTQSARARLVEIILLTLFGVLMYISQVVMASLPNIELVSLLIILTTRKFGYKALLSVYVFVGCEILTYGLSLWVINYLYIWAILCFVVCLVRRIDSVLFYTLISGLYGLTFGTLCSIPNFFIGGIGFGISYIISGLGFDFMHCVGNTVLTLLLYKPLTKVIDKVIKP